MDYAELVELAARLGLGFKAEPNYVLADDYAFLRHLAQGENRYAFNVLSGACQKTEVLAFDYHFETEAKDRKSEDQRLHRCLTAAMVLVPAYFPALHIVPEGLGSSIAEALGCEDIHFESDEFSRAFWVRSKDKRFAYDFCNARVMEYLLANRDLDLQIERCALATVSAAPWTGKEVEYNLRRLLEIRLRLPDYLFTKARTC